MTPPKYRIRYCPTSARVFILGIALAAAPLCSDAAPAKRAARPGAMPKKRAVVAKPPAPAPKPAPAKPEPPKDASIAFFRDGVVPRLKIQISDAELRRLQQENREYVRCTVTENDTTTYEQVGIHLKGAAGSFQGIDAKPALTLNFDKFKDDQVFHDLDKFSLNNSVQDPGYLNELVCSELFLAAGVPAARITHARVWLNGRDLGLYVLKEGFNKNFLRRNKLDPKGNLYEGGFVQDLDGNPRLQCGDGPADRSDVKAVVDACREPDPAKRWARLQQVVDIDRFVSFMAMEQMTCHWDGYCRNRNNYRFYFDPKSGKVQFFPHGMDQMFSQQFSVLETPSALVASAVMNCPEGRRRYRDRLDELVNLLVPADRIQARVDQIHDRLRPVLAEMGAGQANGFDQQTKQLKNQLAERARGLKQSVASEPRPQSFSAAGIAQLPRWEPRKETEDARVELRTGAPGAAEGRLLTITAGPSGHCVASWRTRVLLSPGKYRFEARVRTHGVQAVEDGSGTGAGVRVSGSSRTNKLDGTSNWTLLTYEFQVEAPTQEVELVAELRASAGQVSFDASSLRLVRVAKEGK